MNLEEIEPIIEDIVKQSLSEKVYIYGRFQRSLTSRVASGKFRPSIEQWIRDKKDFKIRDLKTGKFLPKNDKNIKSTSYAITKSIARFGYQNQPKNFVTISYEKILNNTQIRDLIAQSSYDDLLNAIEGL